MNLNLITILYILAILTKKNYQQATFILTFIKAAQIRKDYPL